MSVETSRGPSAVYIQVRGQLDWAEVQDIERLLAQANEEAAVVLDFRDARSFRPTALTRLACDLAGSGRHVSLRGLSEYHYRLLRYAGLCPGVVGAREVPVG